MKTGQQGFTIIEILFALVILASMGIVLSQTFFTSTRSNTKEEILKEVKQNGDFALDTMERIIRNAKSLSSTCGSSNQQSITVVNPDGGSTILGCQNDSDLSGSYTRIASTSAVTGSLPKYLTSTLVTTTYGNLGSGSCDDSTNNKFSISTTKSGTSPCNITINFTLYQRNNKTATFESANAQFQTTVVMRNK